MVALLVLGFGSSSAFAQSDTHSGVMELREWPDVSQIADWGEAGSGWLTQFERLSVEYAYALHDDTVDWTFDLAWSAGVHVYTGQEVQSARRVSDKGRLAELHVWVEAHTDAAPGGVASGPIVFEEMEVGPRPDQVELLWEAVPLDDMFEGLNAEEAREVLESEPEFRIVEVEHVYMHPSEEREALSPRAQRPPEIEPRPPETRRPRGPRTSVGIHIGATRIFRPGARPIGSSSPSADSDSGDSSTRDGRRAEASSDDDDSESSSRRPSRSRSSDDDDDDAPSLAPAALAAGAAVAVLAVAGGSVGISGSADAPIGLTSGYTRSAGGVWLQGHINSAVLTGEGQQRINVQLRGFVDVGWNALQPSIGIGVQAQQDDGTIVSRPVVAPGFVWNAQPVSFFAGHDLVNNTPQWGVVYRFK